MWQLRNRIVFHLERTLLRGTYHRLIFMAACVALVAVSGGLALVALGEPEGALEGIWWAFLRLTDPGYLGEDVGGGRRLLSTLITVGGYVLFMGALIAILTQWLHETVSRLQRGETPVVLSNHVVVLGLTDRTPIVIAELLRQKQRLIRRILSRRGQHRLRVVVLVEDLDETVRADLVERLGAVWDDSAIILRSGSSLDEDHLDRVNVGAAAAVLIPGGKIADDISPRDAGVLKTVLSLTAHPRVRAAETPPRIVAELRDPRLASVLDGVHAGSLELIPSDVIVGQLMAQTLRHEGLSWVLEELLAFTTGCDIYYHDFPDAHGASFRDVALRVHGGVALGLVRKRGRGFVPLLNPTPDVIVEASDRFVIVAQSADGIRFGPVPRSAASTEPPPPPPPVHAGSPATRRVQILGWSPRAVPLLAELATYERESFEVNILSPVSVELREAQLAGAGVSLEQVGVRHVVGDYSNPMELERCDLATCHNVVILGMTTAEDHGRADARAITTALIVDSLIRGTQRRPAVLVELMDAHNIRLLDDRPGEVIVSPHIMGHIMAHIAVRPELYCVVQELFTVHGAELHFRPPHELGLAGRLRFEEIQEAVAACGEIAVGVRRSEAALDVAGDVALAPERDHEFVMDDRALVLVLTTVQGAAL